MSFKSEIKRAALAVLSRSGGFELAKRSAWRHNRLAILCYHSLSTEDEHLWAPALFVSPAHFENRLRFLRDHGFSVIGLGEGLQRLRCGDLPPKAVAITFDDGTVDFHTTAWPLLEKFQMPATVYQTTFYSNYRQPVFGMLVDYLLWKGREQSLDANLWGGEGVRVSTGWPERKNVLEEIERFRLREKLTLPQRDSFAQELARALGVDFGAILDRRTLQVMTPEEVSQVASRGADVQLHTHRHRTPVDKKLFEAEIVQNRDLIQQWTGKLAEHFCYPSGKMAVEFLPWLRDLGVSSAVTCESGLASLDSNSYLLPRIVDTSTLSELELDGWLSGARLLLGKPARAGEIIGGIPPEFD